MEAEQRLYHEPFTIKHPETGNCPKSGEITRGVWISHTPDSPVEQYNYTLRLFQAGDLDKEEHLILCPGCKTPYIAVENQKTSPKLLES